MIKTVVTECVLGCSGRLYAIEDAADTHVLNKRRGFRLLQDSGWLTLVEYILLGKDEPIRTSMVCYVTHYVS